MKLGSKYTDRGSMSLDDIFRKNRSAQVALHSNYEAAMTLVQLTGRMRIVEQLHCRKQLDAAAAK